MHLLIITSSHLLVGQRIADGDRLYHRPSQCLHMCERHAYTCVDTCLKPAFTLANPFPADHTSIQQHTTAICLQSCSTTHTAAATPAVSNSSTHQHDTHGPSFHSQECSQECSPECSPECSVKKPAIASCCGTRMLYQSCISHPQGVPMGGYRQQCNTAG